MAAIPEGFSRVGVVGTYWHAKEWNEEERYYQWNAVPYQGSSWLALKDDPIGPPTNDGENWIVIAKRGDDGEGGVTGLKGEAEGDADFHVGAIIITKAMLGLENVENKSAQAILGELTKDDIESLLETPSLKETLEGKADISDLDNLVLLNVTKETLETILGHVDIAATLDGKLDRDTAKQELALDHVDNLSFEEIKEKLINTSGAEGIVPEDIHAVEKFDEAAQNLLYAAKAETIDTTGIALAETLEQIGEKFNPVEKHQALPEEYAPLNDLVVLLTPLIHLLKGGYYNWLVEEFLADIHPVTGVRGEAEDKFNSGKVTITKESLGLGQVPDQHPDSVGTGFLFSGTCTTPGDVGVKEITVQDDFTLQEGRVVFITFMENNLAPDVQLDINGSGPVPVNIKTFPVKEYNCETFEKFGNYLFQYDGNAWNFVTGSNDIIDVRTVTLEVESWTYLEEDGVWMIEIELENLSGNEDLTVDVPTDLPDEEYDRNFEIYQRANLIDGESTGHSLILYAQKKPRGPFTVWITVAV